MSSAAAVLATAQWYILNYKNGPFEWTSRRTMVAREGRTPGYTLLSNTE
jgi:hypothetical protein